MAWTQSAGKWLKNDRILTLFAMKTYLFAFKINLRIRCRWRKKGLTWTYWTKLENLTLVRCKNMITSDRKWAKLHLFWTKLDETWRKQDAKICWQSDKKWAKLHTGLRQILTSKEIHFIKWKWKKKLWIFISYWTILYPDFVWTIYEFWLMIQFAFYLASCG